MLKTYLPGDTAKLTFRFTDDAGKSVKVDSDVVLNVGEEGRTTVLVQD